MKKKILIVSRSFYPQNSPRSFRTTELVKEFARTGHDVTLITPKKSEVHVSFEEKYAIEIIDLGKKKFPDINITKGNKYVLLFKRMIRRVLLQLFAYPDIELMFQVKKVLKKEKNYDLLISIAVPFQIHWGVAWTRTNKHQIAKIWVADCGDPFYFNSHDTFSKLFYFKYFEKWFSRKADYITIPFGGLKKYFFREFDQKYQVIPQGFNFSEVKIATEPVNNKIITFAFAGGFMKNSRDPRKFLDFLLKIKTPFKFIVYNRQKEFTQPYEEILGDKLIVKNYIPREELLLELSTMDFLVNFEYDITNQIPSKLIDYTLVKRPILLVKNKEFNEAIIHKFLIKDYKHQFIFDQFDKYNIENVANKFLNLS